MVVMDSYSPSILYALESARPAAILPEVVAPQSLEGSTSIFARRFAKYLPVVAVEFNLLRIAHLSPKPPTRRENIGEC